MLNEFSDELYQELAGQLAAVGPAGENPARQFKTCLGHTKKAIERLEAYVTEHPFADRAEESCYTEQILPRFRALEFYYYELMWLICNRPIGDRFEWMGYYRQELEAIRHFLNRHAAYYQLYKVKSMGLEDVLSDAACLGRWIGTESCAVMPIKERTELFARFIAYNKLQHYLLEQISLLWEIERAHPQGLRSKQLRWTGDICNLVELVYGLYETKQINNGEVSLTEVANCMEQLFQINLSRAYRAFINIRRRKVVSQTRFMEQMRSAILHRIDQYDAYIPQSFRQGFARQ